MAVPFLSVFLLDAWHVPLRHQSYPLGLNHLDVQHLLLMLPHVSLMPELYLKRPNPIQCLLKQLLHIVCLRLGYCLIAGSLPGGIIQVRNLFHAVLAYIQARWQPKGIGILSNVGKCSLELKNDVQLKRKYYFNLLPKPFVVFCLIC